MKIRGYFISVFFCTLAAVLFSKDENIKFETVSLEQGLSQSAVNCIVQDSRGYLWFGTQDGLNRYDGCRFRTYKYKQGDPSSLSNSNIRCLLQDWDEDVLWIGTLESGLDKFDIKKETFPHYRNQTENPNSLGSNRIRSICPDRNGDLGLGLWRGDLIDLTR